MKKLTDPQFKYVPSHSTDIRKTFKRLRKEEKAQAEQVVVPINRNVKR